jgi:hypothetical protein
MKRKLIFAASFLLISWAFTSCDGLSGCETCKFVIKTSSGDLVSESGGTEHCGVELDIFIAANPTITDPITGNVTTLECN